MRLNRVDLITIEPNAIDWEALKTQKAVLFAIAFQMGASIQRGDADDATRNTYTKLEALLNFLDYIQDRAALTYGDKKIFGEPDHEED